MRSASTVVLAVGMISIFNAVGTCALVTFHRLTLENGVSSFSRPHTTVFLAFRLSVILGITIKLDRRWHAPSSQC